MRFAVFFYTCTAFEHSMTSGKNGLCRLSKLFQCVIGALGFFLRNVRILLYFLFIPFHILILYAADEQLSAVKSKTGAFSSGVPGTTRSV